MDDKIFRKKSLDRIASLDRLDDYLKVSSPSVWIVLLALVLVVIAAGSWCIFGSLPRTVMGVGVQSGEETVCFVTVSEGYEIRPGMEVRLIPDGSEDTYDGIVVEVAEPVAASEAAAEAGAGWLAMPDNWVCPLTVQIKDKTLPEKVSCTVRIILEENRPIDLFLGR